MIRIHVDPVRPDLASIDRAADAIRQGRVIAIPTDTLYGLAVDPINHQSVARVFAIKGREQRQSLLLVAADTPQVTEWFGNFTEAAAGLVQRFWPGPLTLVLRAPDTLAPGVTDERMTVGVRVPDHAVTRALCAAAGRPLTATSANISGEAPTNDPSEVERQLGDRIDLLLDSGLTLGGQPSTIVDVTGDSPRLIRAGAIPWSTIEICLARQ